MSEISIDDIPAHTPGHTPLPARPPVLDISMWTEKFCSMAAVLSTRFPEKAPEFFSHLASILRAELLNFDDGRWVAYDCCYRREALAQKNLDWSVPNARLYNEAFTGRETTSPSPVHATRTSRGLGGSPMGPTIEGWDPAVSCLLGANRQPNPAGDIMPVPVDWQRQLAATSTPVPSRGQQRGGSFSLPEPAAATSPLLWPVRPMPYPSPARTSLADPGPWQRHH